jgi:DNA repair protein RadC
MKTFIPEFKIGLKKKGSFEEMFPVERPENAADFCRKCFDSDMIDWKEEFIVIALNRANKAIGFYKISSGGITGTVADPRVIFQFALLCNASTIILSHNHPSGNKKPSEGDREITHKVAEVGRLLDIKVLDHIIVTSEGYYSFSENDLI